MKCHDHEHDALGPAPATAPEYWRHLDEFAQKPEFVEEMHREFPVDASVWQDDASRRSFLKLMGASIALAGVGGIAGCVRQPDEKIVPYVAPPEQVVPGKPLFFATAMTLGGFAKGLLAESQMGRPIKVEGNPKHPASLGATDVFAQASVLGLYDPDRSRTVFNAGAVNTWSAFEASLGQAMKKVQETQGKGLRILTETITSPTLADQLQGLLKQFPQAKWHQYEPINRDNIRAGSIIAFGRYVNTIYDFSKAERVVSLDSNFLIEEAGSLRYSREFINGRRLRAYDVGGSAKPQAAKRVTRELAAKIAFETKPADDGAFLMNRLYVVETTPTSTGAIADHRISVKPSELEAVARALAGAVGVNAGAMTQAISERIQAVVDAIATDLKAMPGKSILIAGFHQSPAVHALAHAMNVALGNVGTTVAFTEPVEANPIDQHASITELVSEMNAGTVEALFILEGNPVYNAPSPLNFKAAMAKVPFRVHHSLYYDETSFESHWHLPATHYLETWSDARAFDGTLSIIQPLIAPLYVGRSAHEVIALLTGARDDKGYTLVRDFWQSTKLGGVGADFEKIWQQTLHDGLLAGSAFPAVPISLVANLSIPASELQPGELEVAIRPDPCVYDGRFANNGWLQELPKPLTKITWDNVAIVSKTTADGLDWANEALIEIKSGDNPPISVPVFRLPGQPDGVITVHTGYGRERAGAAGGSVEGAPGSYDGDERGGNAFLLRTTPAWFTTQAVIGRNADGKTRRLAITQPHHNVEGRDLIRAHPIEEFQKKVATHTVEKKVHHLSLYPAWKYGEANGTEMRYPHQHAWGMSIDNNACIGCNACVVACQAENNSPVVGKEQVIFGREMQWLRIDTYWSGDAENPDALEGPFFEPMMCQHCEIAPCEVVCPVAATSHSAEGINEMTYNRCVGTRYCSNNCPYKVRRFNFFQYQDTTTPVLKLLRNPDVTVRERGVMEKCTYCIQRINSSRIEFKKLRAAEGDEQLSTETKQNMDELMSQLQTACQQSCPTEAIIFGDLNYEYADGSPMQVVKLKSQEQDWALLAELNTKPRSTYLPRFTNKNPGMGMTNDQTRMTNE